MMKVTMPPIRAIRSRMKIKVINQSGRGASEPELVKITIPKRKYQADATLMLKNEIEEAILLFPIADRPKKDATTGSRVAIMVVAT